MKRGEAAGESGDWPWVCSLVVVHPKLSNIRAHEASRAVTIAALPGLALSTDQRWSVARHLQKACLFTLASIRKCARL